MLSRDQLPERIVTERTVVRPAVAEDLPKIAAWPAYSWPSEGFSMTAESSRSHEDARYYWWQRIDRPDRCHYSVLLREGGEVIGVHALVRIDWAAAVVGNMGVRIRADWCGHGCGSESLAPLLQAVLTCGMHRIRLDVAATNLPAIRCYQKCGMRIVDEFWLEHTGSPIDAADPKWAPLLPHLRREEDKWMVRFLWMEVSREHE